MDKQELINSLGDILVIDDEKIIQQGVANYINNMGYTAIHAFNGRDAMEALEESTPALILLDIFIPGENSLEILHLFRHYPELKDTPVIVISGTRNAGLIANYLREGADDYIQKPFNAELFRKRLYNALKYARDGSSDQVSVEIKPDQLKEKDHEIKVLQYQLRQANEQLVSLKETSSVQPREEDTQELITVRALLGETLDKLNRTMEGHKALTDQLEHDLNNVLAGVSTASEILAADDSSV